MPCSYCGREGGAPLDVLIERIGTSLPAEWGNADDEGVGWEGGYVGKTYDTYDLITKRVTRAQRLRADRDVVRLPEQGGRARLYRLRPDDACAHGWRSSRSRQAPPSVLSSPIRARHGGPGLHGGAGRAAVPSATRCSTAGLVRPLPDEPIYRVRTHGCASPRTAASWALPPRADRQIGAGEPCGGPALLRGADPSTATAEACEANPGAEAGRWARSAPRRPAGSSTSRTPPEVPTCTNPSVGTCGLGLIFLRHFVSEIAKALLSAMTRIHIEYVPTTVVTEWLRTRFDPGPGEALVGVLYGSSRSPGG